MVMISLHEEQVRGEDTAYALLIEHGSLSQSEAGSYFPELPGYDHGMSGHLESLRRASEALDIPIIASLNGMTGEGWTQYARELEQAGAAALELNVFVVPADGSTGSEVEARYIDIVRRVKASVGIPVSVKLSPFFSALGHLAGQLEGVGADGLVLFNRFLQRNIDLENLAIEVDRRLSTPEEIHLPLVWIALLSRRVRLSLAASRGVESYRAGGEVPPGRGRRRDDDLGAPPPRSPASTNAALGSRALAGGEPFLLGGGDSRPQGRDPPGERGEAAAGRLREIDHRVPPGAVGLLTSRAQAAFGRVSSSSTVVKARQGLPVARCSPMAQGWLLVR